MSECGEKTGADLLREAATKMRAKAERATTFRDATTGESLAWSASPHGDVHGLGGDWICDTASASLAEHVASWHPAVALAVADWLDNEARSLADYADIWQRPSAGIDQPPAVAHGKPERLAELVKHHFGPALAVARAYLAAPVGI